MLRLHVKIIVLLLSALVVAGMLSSCGPAAAPQSDKAVRQNYYDQYMSMPGEGSFGRPVVFLPGDESYDELDVEPDAEPDAEPEMESQESDY